MAKKCNIYIKNEHGICDFLWANTSGDGSVILGTSYNGFQKTHAIFEHNRILREDYFVLGHSLNHSKISFHASGLYKTSTMVGKTKESLDRCTIQGPPLLAIKKPRIMLDILLPIKLRTTTKTPKDRDIVIAATGFYNRPYRCLVWCADINYFTEWSKRPSKVIDTSLVESSMGLEAGNRVWIFTLRQNMTDKYTNNEFTFFIPGQPKWGHIKRS